jgi:hypothetical protein
VASLDKSDGIVLEHQRPRAPSLFSWPAVCRRSLEALGGVYRCSRKALQENLRPRKGEKQGKVKGELIGSYVWMTKDAMMLLGGNTRDLHS